MANPTRCERTGQPFFFRIHPIGAGTLCPRGSIMPSNCEEHRHCGDSDTHPECTLCREISATKQCPDCDEIVTIFSQYADLIKENNVGENEISVDEVTWITDSPDYIVISAEFQKLEIGSTRWKNKIFDLIHNAITRGDVRIKVYTKAHEETVWLLIEEYRDGFLTKLKEKLQRDIDVISPN